MNAHPWVKRIKTRYPLHPDKSAEDQSLNLKRPAAVLIVCFEKNDCLHLLMIERAYHLRFHAGEISFPGGVFEKKDDGLIQTALRETQEEVGLDIHPRQVIARLNPVTTRLGIHVTPFVAMNDGPLSELTRNEGEVKTLLEVPMGSLLQTERFDQQEKKLNHRWVYFHEHYRIWGATGTMIFDFLECFKEGSS